MTKHKVKVPGYWPVSQSMNMQKQNEAKIQPPTPNKHAQ